MQVHARWGDVLAKVSSDLWEAAQGRQVTQPEGVKKGFLEEELLNWSFKVLVGYLRPKRKEEKGFPATVLRMQGKMGLAAGLPTILHQLVYQMKTGSL